MAVQSDLYKSMLNTIKRIDSEYQGFVSLILPVAIVIVFIVAVSVIDKTVKANNLLTLEGRDILSPPRVALRLHSEESICTSTNLGGLLWISRIRVDQIAVVLKPF